MISRAFFGMFADHFEHSEVTFDVGDMMLEDLTQ